MLFLMVAREGHAATSRVHAGLGRLRRSWPLNQLNAVTHRIDREAEDGTAISERAWIAGHRSTGGLDRRDGRRHVLHDKNHVRYRVLHIVRVAMKQDHQRVFVSLGG